MGRNIVKAKLDIIFKTMFSKSENEDILHSFLSTMLELPYDSIKEIVIQNSEILPETITGKFSRLDLKMQVDDKLVNVEMQIKNEPDFNDRVLYYWSKLYSGDLKSGDEYGDLKQSISINIINFNMFECPEFHSCFKVLEVNRHELLTDKCAIHFFELKKINKKINKNNRMELWLQLINAESEEELEMLRQTNVPEIQKAVMVIHQMSEDEKIQELARLREKALHDEASALGHARREGEQIGIEKGEKIGIEKGERIGIEKGKEEERANIAARLKELGLSDDMIKAALNK